ncbi:aldehyde dehydrogenase family protein [Streptomyces sp. BK340]|uniref:aldehyde dehydrogenase family protein n=1 Tax=Streptomyces sp. BK340 TaxID=2572903 RepID=UPI0011AE0189|nr:aldehyde dehydrogenase family protein [Streptomyces sp. BK340]TVZ84890.1 aldehyde dehydrogenase family protein [Streptomyces sp. BK340]
MRWNFPFALGTKEIAPALEAGCAVVLKPSEQTLQSAPRLGHLAAVAGISPTAPST